MRRLVLIRTSSTKVTMPAFRIVEAVDVIRYIPRGGFTSGIDLPFDPLLLEAAEERLGDRVIPAVSTAAHARLQIVGQAEPSPSVAAVLRALIRVDDRLARASPANGLRDRLKNQFLVDRRPSRPSHHLP